MNMLCVCVCGGGGGEANMLCRGVHGLCWCTRWWKIVSGCTGHVRWETLCGCARCVGVQVGDMVCVGVQVREALCGCTGG